MLHLHRADRADHLADALGELLARAAARIRSPPSWSPFPPAAWSAGSPSGSAARLGASPGRSDGICAGIEFPPPAAAARRRAGRRLGRRPRDAIRGCPSGSVWPLLEVVEALAGEPWLAPLARDRRPGGDGEDAELRRGRRLSVVRHLADAVPSLRPLPPRADRRPGPPGTTRTAPARRCPSGCAGRRSCGGRCGSGSVTRARPSGWPAAAERLRAEPGHRRAARAAGRVRPHATGRRRHRARARTRARTRGPPVPAPSLAGAVGCRSPSRGPAGPAGAAHEDRSRRAGPPPAAALLGPRRARAPAHASAPREGTDHRPPGRARGRHAARAPPGRHRRRPPHRRGAAASGDERRRARPDDGSCRSTPATAARARSRCCATRCSARSRPIRRSSPAT